MRIRARIPNSQFLIVNFLVLTVCLSTWSARAQSPEQLLPPGDGRDVFVSVCSLCHSPAAPAGKQWTRTQWESKVTEMLQEEPEVTAEERAAIVDYLSANFKPGGRIYVNLAAAKDLAVLLDLPTKDADAIARYRDENGAFKTLDDLKKVPGVDGARLDVKKDRLAFAGKE